MGVSVLEQALRWLSLGEVPMYHRGWPHTGMRMVTRISTVHLPTFPPLRTYLSTYLPTYLPTYRSTYPTTFLRTYPLPTLHI